MDKVKNIVEQALSNEKGVSTMGTIAEKFINEGIQQGRQQGIQHGRQQGIQQGLQQAIELGLEIKFGDKGLLYAQKIKDITDIQKLQNIMKAIKTIKKLNELDQVIN